MLNVTMSVTKIFRKKLLVAGTFLLGGLVLASNFFVQDTFATNVSSSFINFINNERSQPASNRQADGLYNQLISNNFRVCADSSSYRSGAVNSKDGGQSFVSLLEWSTSGAEELSADWRNKSNRLINLLAGNIDSGNRLEYNQSDNSEGWCTYIVRMATEVNIPITGRAVQVTDTSEARSSFAGVIGERCTVAFNEASDNILRSPAQITSFINKLNDSTYNSKVRDLATTIQAREADAQECYQLAEVLSAEIEAEKTAICEADPNASGCPSAGGIQDSVSSCQVEGVGWIVCPVMIFLAGIVDAAYDFVESLLVVQPLTVTGDSAGIYSAWSVMRDIANVAFVIAFLIIIFSQLTGVGVSNYGVKKMLPRIVIAAILVNVSFWICALAVDASNIIGSSVRGLFLIIENRIPAPPITNVEDVAGAGWVGIVAVVLAAGAGIALYAGLSVLIPAILGAVLAILTIFIVLTLRQALIVLLIVIAPLAFVAYLLPNTEGWFTKWRKFFATLLLMYPIIAALFGASALASTIVMRGAEGQEYATAIQIMGAAIAIIPLALTPVVMKAAGGVLNRFAGLVNNAQRGPFDRLKRGGENLRKNRQEFRKLKSMSGGRTLPGYGIGSRMKARRAAVLNNRQSELKRSTAEYISDRAENSERFREQLANGGGAGANQRALDQALNIKASIEAEEVKAAANRIEKLVLSEQDLRTVAAGGKAGGIDGSDLATRKAVFQKMVATGDYEGINQTWDRVKSDQNMEVRRAFADSMASSPNKPLYMGQGALQEMRSGAAASTSSQQLIENAIEANAYSAEGIAGRDKEELKLVAKVHRESPTLTSEARIRLRDNALTATRDDRLKNQVSKNIKVVNEIAGLRDPSTEP